MPIIDFGQIGAALKAGMSAAASRSIDVVPTGTTTITSMDFNNGNFSDAIAQAQMTMISPAEMLWGSHTWDDAEHEVVK